MEDNFYDDEVLIHEEDTRKFIQDTKVYPYNCIGLLKGLTQNETGVTGTGFLIGPNLVLTVAHNIYHPNQGFYRNLTFYPGLNGENKFEKEYQVADYRILEKYKANCRKQEGLPYDYALLQLKEVVVRQKYLPLMKNWSEVNQKITISGYPKERLKMPLFKIVCAYQYEGSGNSLEHLVDTTIGQSGSPILVTNEGQIQVIGIHKGGTKPSNGNFNVGPRVGSQMVQQLQAWQIEMLFRSSITVTSKTNLEYNPPNDQQESSGSDVDLLDLTLSSPTLKEIHTYKPRLDKPILRQEIREQLEQWKKDNHKTWESIIKIQSSKQQKVSLRKNQLVDNSILIIMRDTNYYDHVVAINLSQNNLTGKGIRMLTQTKWNSLKMLYLWENQIDDLKEWKPQNLPNLVLLSFLKNKIDELPDNIISLSKLQQLSIGENQLSKMPASLARLKKKHQNLTLVRIYGNYIDCELRINKEVITELMKEGVNLGEKEYKLGEKGHFATQRKRVESKLQMSG